VIGKPHQIAQVDWQVLFNHLTLPSSQERLVQALLDQLWVWHHHFVHESLEEALFVDAGEVVHQVLQLLLPIHAWHAQSLQVHEEPNFGNLTQDFALRTKHNLIEQHEACLPLSG